MTVWGNALIHPRTLEPAPNRRRRCGCGCGGKQTHVGLANGVALMGGCEWAVRRWVRDPLSRLGKDPR